MNSFLHLNTDGIFGRAEKPSGEQRIRSSNAFTVIFLVLAAVLAAVSIIAFASKEPDGAIAGWMCLGAAILMAVIAPFAASPKITLLPEGLRIRRLGNEEDYSWEDVAWFETQGVEKVTLHMRDRKYEYMGKDWQILMGALRAGDVRGFDPDDSVPGGLGVKRLAAGKSGAAALLIVSVALWAEFLIPSIPREVVIVLSVFFGAFSLLFIFLAVSMLRQKTEFYEDGFYLTKAIGGRKFFRYDEFSGRTVKTQNASQYGGKLITVTLFTADGRKAVIQHALLCPELLELVGFDSLPFMDHAGK